MNLLDRSMNITDRWLSSMAATWDHGSLAYNHEAKLKAHREAKRLFTYLVDQQLFLDPQKYFIRSNMAGIGVSGEVTLTTDKDSLGIYGIMIQIGQSACGLPSVLYRAVDHRCDYKGYRNNFSTVDEAFGSVEKIDAFRIKIRELCGKPNQSRY